MIRMQDKVLNAIEETAKSYELEAVISYGASNTGKLHIMNGFDNVLIISFNFQTAYASFETCDDKGKTVACLCNPYLEFSSSLKLKRFLENVDHYLREYDMEKEGA